MGLILGAIGWCIFQPNAAQALARRTTAGISVILAGPQASKSAPTFGQLADFAWEATGLVAGVVFLAFFLTGTVVTYLFLEWAGKSKNVGVQK